jgi:hypothetical protein
MITNRDKWKCDGCEDGCILYIEIGVEPTICPMESDEEDNAPWVLVEKWVPLDAIEGRR